MFTPVWVRIYACCACVCERIVLAACVQCVCVGEGIYLVDHYTHTQKQHTETKNRYAYVGDQL